MEIKIKGQCDLDTRRQSQDLCLHSIFVGRSPRKDGFSHGGSPPARTFPDCGTWVLNVQQHSFSRGAFAPNREVVGTQTALGCWSLKQEPLRSHSNHDVTCVEPQPIATFSTSADASTLQQVLPEDFRTLICFLAVETKRIWPPTKAGSVQQHSARRRSL